MDCTLKLSEIAILSHAARDESRCYPALESEVSTCCRLVERDLLYGGEWDDDEKCWKYEITEAGASYLATVAKHVTLIPAAAKGGG